MAVEVDRPVLTFVPLRVKERIFGVQQILDALGCIFRSVRYGERMIVENSSAKAH